MSKISRPLAALVMIALIGAGCSNGSSNNDSSGGGKTATNRDGKANTEEMKARLKFAACMRKNGVKDFPDRDPAGPLINVRNAQSIPGFQDALQKCRDLLPGGLGGQ